MNAFDVWEICGIDLQKLSSLSLIFLTLVYHPLALEYAMRPLNDLLMILPR